jgi:hypothetical protein
MPDSPVVELWHVRLLDGMEVSIPIAQESMPDLSLMIDPGDLVLEMYVLTFT